MNRLRDFMRLFRIYRQTLPPLQALRFAWAAARD